jgi:hypothetical protein
MSEIVLKNIENLGYYLGAPFLYLLSADGQSVIPPLDVGNSLYINETGQPYNGQPSNNIARKKNITDLVYYMNPQISAPAGYNIVIEPSKMILDTTFYDIFYNPISNVGNNIIIIWYDFPIQSFEVIEINQGTYTGPQLAVALNVKLLILNISIIYIPEQKRFEFTNAATKNYYILLADNINLPPQYINRLCIAPLGLVDSNSNNRWVIPLNNGIINGVFYSPICCEFRRTRAISIGCSIFTESSQSNIENINDNLLLRLPYPSFYDNSPPDYLSYNLIDYNLFNPVRINQATFSSIRIQLRDDLGSIINFNGGGYLLHLKVSFVPKMNSLALIEENSAQFGLGQYMKEYPQFDKELADKYISQYSFRRRKKKKKKKRVG